MAEILDEFKKDPDAVLEWTINWGAPSWLTATTYKRHDIVWNPDDGLWYRCIKPHTSTSSVEDDSENWKKRGDMWLDAADGEQLSTETFLISPSGSLTEDSKGNNGYAATVWLSSGTADESYEVTCRITTNKGRTDDRTILLEVLER